MAYDELVTAGSHKPLSKQLGLTAKLSSSKWGSFLLGVENYQGERGATRIAAMAPTVAREFLVWTDLVLRNTQCRECMIKGLSRNTAGRHMARANLTRDMHQKDKIRTFITVVVVKVEVIIYVGSVL